MTCVERYPVGRDITAYVVTSVTEKTFVKISGTRKSRALGSNYGVAPATAAGAAFGVAKETVASGSDLTVGVHGPGKIVPVTTGTGGVTAGQEVEIATGGVVVTYSSGIKVGMALTTASAGADADVRIY